MENQKRQQKQAFYRHFWVVMWLFIEAGVTKNDGWGLFRMLLMRLIDFLKQKIKLEKEKY